MVKLKKLPLPGLRNIKTALSVFICLVIYGFMQRDGVILAVTSALICLQDSVEKSVSDGMNRVLGTTLGGVLGIVYLAIFKVDATSIVWNLIISAGIVIIIYFFNVVDKRGSITIACFVFLVITLDTKLDSPIFYSIDRIINTIIGIVIAVLVNQFLFRPSHDRVQNKNYNNVSKHLVYNIIKSDSQKFSKWSGGETKELYIFPQNSIYSERNFKWRISTSTSEIMESDLVILNEYMRHVMVLKGKLKLIHENNHMITLKPFEQDYFNGKFKTKSVGLGKDFNLMLKKDYEGKLYSILNNETNALKTFSDMEELFETKIIYSLKDGVNLKLCIESEEVINIEMNEGDLIVFEHIDMLSDKSLITTTNQELSEEILCIVACVRKMN